MFERILEISDIENKIIAKIDYNLDNNGTDADNNITINLKMLPFLWTGVPERFLNIHKPLERYGGEVQLRAHIPSFKGKCLKKKVMVLRAATVVFKLNIFQTTND